MIQFSITTDPNQRFSTVIGNKRVTIQLRYSATTDRWSFDLALDDEPLLYGRRVVTGVDLLKPFALGVGAIFAYSELEEAPGRDALPNGAVRLYSATQTEIDEVLAA